MLFLHMRARQIYFGAEKDFAFLWEHANFETPVKLKPMHQST